MERQLPRTKPFALFVLYKVNGSGWSFNSTHATLDEAERAALKLAEDDRETYHINTMKIMEIRREGNPRRIQWD